MPICKLVLCVSIYKRVSCVSICKIVSEVTIYKKVSEMSICKSVSGVSKLMCYQGVKSITIAKCDTILVYVRNDWFLARKTHCKNAQNLPSHLIMIGCIGSPRNSCIGVMRIIDGRSGSNHSIMSSLASWLMPSVSSKAYITAIDMIDLDMT